MQVGDAENWGKKKLRKFIKGNLMFKRVRTKRRGPNAAKPLYNDKK